MARPVSSGTYLDPTLSTDERVADLLERMTLDEKVGQLVGTCVGDLGKWSRDVDDVMRDIDEHHVGAVAPFGWGGSPNETAEEAVDAANRLQTHALEESRLGIPLLFAADAIHGHAYINDATVFPNNLGMAATWDPDLVERVAAVTAKEMRATGARQNYDPTCDVVRDPRWGRTGETFGESPRLCGELAASKVRGYQGERLDERSVAATAKHFPAYGDPVRGEDAAPVDVSSHTLRTTFLPPFERVIEEGVAAVMPCYNSIGGEPAHASRRFLTGLLRDDLGFEGIVVSDWNGVAQLHEEHRTARSPKAAALQTRVAGLDIGSVAGPEHARHLLDLVDESKLSEDVIDASVERVLHMKFRLGLFEEATVDTTEAERTLASFDHLETARESVRKSLTLLQNDDGALPLSSGLDEVFVTGPNADEMIHQLGGWSSHNEDADLPGTTVLEGIRKVSEAETTVTYEPGSGINESIDVDAAAEGAASADVAIVVLGENWYLHEFGPEDQAGSATGEFPTRSQLSLPDAQRELVAAVRETGTPIVAVLVTGRPLAVEWLTERVPAVLLSYYPGTVGGEVVATTLFGETDPGGRLPISIPRSAEQLPTRFNYRSHPCPIGEDEHPPSYDPLFEFGHGLSYTTFEYRSVDVSSTTLGANDTIDVTVSLENTGDRTGSEVVRLFFRDEYSSQVTPVRELCDFERVELDPDERATVTFEVSASTVGLADRDRQAYANDGFVELFVEEDTIELQVDLDDA